jgi:hypothetical protein
VARSRTSIESGLHVEMLRRSGVDNDFVEAGARRQMQAIIDAIEKFHGEVESAERSGSFSQKGLHEMKGRLVEQTRRALAGPREAVKKWQERAKSETERLLAESRVQPTDPVQALLWFLRQQEISPS